MNANDIPIRTKVIFISNLGIWTLGMHPDWLYSSVSSGIVESPLDKVLDIVDFPLDENALRNLCSLDIFSKMAMLVGRIMAKAESIAMHNDQVGL